MPRDIDQARRWSLGVLPSVTHTPHSLQPFVRGGVFATGFNLATAPTFAKYGYPQFALSCVTDQAPALIKKYPGLLVFQQSTTTFAKGAISVLKKLKDGGQIGNKVAVVNVGDDFGIELANAGGRSLRKGALKLFTTNLIRSAPRTMHR